MATKNCRQKKAQKAQNEVRTKSIRKKILFCAFCAFLWLGLIEFFDEAAAHETGGDECGSVIVHFFQQLLAPIVDETNTCQIN
jgi:hypothetical protein